MNVYAYYEFEYADTRQVNASILHLDLDKHENKGIASPLKGVPVPGAPKVPTPLHRKVELGPIFSSRQYL